MELDSQDQGQMGLFFIFIEVVVFKASSLIAQLVKNPPAMWETLG